MVVAEAGPLLVQGHQEQAGRIEAMQHCRRVLPAGDRRARVRGQLAEDAGVEHEPGHLGWLLLQDLIAEVLGDRVAADAQRPRCPPRILAPRSDSAAICTAAAHPSVR